VGLVDAVPCSGVFPRRWWCPVARSSALGRRPLAVALMDSPLVVFRGAEGAPAVLLDRCDHRNYPLSLGRVTGDGVLECGYHGWTYDGGGHCVRVPGLLRGRPQARRSPCVPSQATAEPAGVAWACGAAETEPAPAPAARSRGGGPAGWFPGTASIAACAVRWRPLSTFRPPRSCTVGSPAAAMPAASPGCAALPIAGSRCSTLASPWGWARSGCRET